MGYYKVYVDLEATAHVVVNAPDPETAEKIGLFMVEKNPMYYLQSDGYIGDPNVWEDGTEELENFLIPVAKESKEN